MKKHTKKQNAAELQKITVVVPSELKGKIKAECDKHLISASHFLRKLILGYFESQGGK